MGLFDQIKKIVGVQDPLAIMTADKDKLLQSYYKTVSQINQVEEKFEKLSNIELQSTTKELKLRIRDGASLDSILVEAFAAVREATWRVLKLRHFDVQVSPFSNCAKSM